MKKFKLILPALVFVFTFAISFASVSDMFVIKYAYQTGSDCIELAENPCPVSGPFTCTVISSTNGGPFPVYLSDVDLSAPAQCATAVPTNDPSPVLVP
ncbi:DUF6520 family protein [Sinomicrobium oceani]|uniref:DUF6520 family protein n=1 Tax=Sinomicrobium oceani TaxID=1150368 RepID=UPI00227CA531|nr:DUF6520 family protein [Sinomicrobium oceani]